MLWGEKEAFQAFQAAEENKGYLTNLSLWKNYDSHKQIQLLSQTTSTVRFQRIYFTLSSCTCLEKSLKRSGNHSFFKSRERSQ